METLKELNYQIITYFQKHYSNGGTSEFDKSINDLSRMSIDAFKKERGECWLFKINRYKGDEGKPFLVKYIGQKVYNFEYDGAIPAYNKKFENLLKDYNDKYDHPKDIAKKLKKYLI